ncbi:xylulokinase [Limnoglobus roseus]|uniref:Xylulose kinase n=1 Tax=Limnoglobus roseus TaxID=2598579 RepID=A0A5C1A660_9BACT|nr:FGGY family carbohydrate kinase [Limnoglobus roseus]QEL13476.1 xylulose kinase [Limnoglobus roseus]
MSEALRHVPPDAIIVGWDFSTGSVKALAFDPSGNVRHEVRLPTDLWTEGGVSELSLLQLEGQALASARAMGHWLEENTDSGKWLAAGISATHHSAGLLDANAVQVRRMICWNDQTLAKYHGEGLQRLGGQDRVKELIGGPWAVRYSLSHLVKDEHTLSAADWDRTAVMLPHGPAAAGFLTGRFDCTSVSSAASTGMMDLRKNEWRAEMLFALADPARREQAWKHLPRIIDMNDPVGPLSEAVAAAAKMTTTNRPLIFPTLDDQAAGLVGGGAVDAGQVAIILGNSAVVNSSAAFAPQSGTLDAMKLNWGPYLWMRCYTNGAQFLDKVIGEKPNWTALEAAARKVPAGCGGVTVLPFLYAEPSVGVNAPRFQWTPSEPTDGGTKLRASFEALSYLIGLAVKEHEAAGQTITRVTVSGGIARNDLMLEILASVLDRELVRLVSAEGPALGAAVAALAGYETHQRRKAGDNTPYTVADAVTAMVKFRPEAVKPNPEWRGVYQQGLAAFAAKVKG